jgi:hypothetical protein
MHTSGWVDYLDVFNRRQLPSAREHHQDDILTEKLNAVQGHPLECRQPFVEAHIICHPIDSGHYTLPREGY